ncbi:SDR family NAD(P)-dependent oxidoreductase [Marinilabilia rubra]|uniref:NAD(P)-dependent oxidoreductase n=1 Tax=Marinilabilia rubra TaxID=2162893 RepID=A0A2U2B5S4_9BACT|nr:SDR family NAD(P)-dependent oxidoreductase [Marinilabilia rubra]PWD98383.1 NAD(P)-dependent oxidoreductase [Marinilabilia rubra]
MNKKAIITGASSGIGEACAAMLARIGYDLIITGRRSERLENLANKLENKNTAVKILTFDVRDRKASKDVLDTLPEDWKKIDLLINNAGLAAGADPIQEGDWDDWERMIDTNLKGLLTVSQLVIPGMIQRKSGHIINVSSIAGSEVYANGNVYCASKHAVHALTKGMRIDLLPHNIKVGSIAPGMVETEFSIVRYHGDQEKADKVYEGLTPLYANDVADAVEFMVTRPAHVNVNDMLLMPTAQASAVYNYRE